MFLDAYLFCVNNKLEIEINAFFAMYMGNPQRFSCIALDRGPQVNQTCKS